MPSRISNPFAPAAPRGPGATGSRVSDPFAGGGWQSAWQGILSPTGQMMQGNPELAEMMQYGAGARSLRSQFRSSPLGPGGPPILPSAGAVAAAERQATGYDRMMDFGARAKAMAADYRSRGIRGVLPQAAVTGYGERFGRGLMQEEVGRQQRMMRSQSAEDRLRLGEAIQSQQQSMSEQGHAWQDRMAGYGQQAARMGTDAQLAAMQSGKTGKSYWERESKPMRWT